MERTPLLKDMHNPPVSPNFSAVFSFEKNFDAKPKQQWMKEHWHYAFYYSIIYLIIIFSAQAYMKSRIKLNLRIFQFSWDCFLAMFSLWGFSRIFPELLHVMRTFGFTYSVCNPSYIEEINVTGFWTYMFAVSKAFELGDTVFIVLHKQPLIFLHWYHHCTVLLFIWYSYPSHLGPQRWYMSMNYFIHTIMYSYYAAKAIKMKIPKFVSIFLTTTQLMQMVTGLFITSYGYIVKQNGTFCQLPGDVTIYAILMFTTYFILFFQFFYNAYLSPSSKIKKIK